MWFESDFQTNAKIALVVFCLALHPVVNPNIDLAEI